VADGGTGSLRDAILQANRSAAPDRIVFQLPPPQVPTITLTSPLPRVTEPLTIDGRTQQGFAGSPIVQINGPAGVPGSIGLQFSAGNSQVLGLILVGFDVGIQLDTQGGDVIAGNYLGVDRTGLKAIPHAGPGINILTSSNTIGGTSTLDRNLIAGSTLT